MDKRCPRDTFPLTVIGYFTKIYSDVEEGDNNAIQFNCNCKIIDWCTSMSLYGLTRYETI